MAFFTETFTEITGLTLDSTWRTVDLTSFGVPDSAVVAVRCLHTDDAADATLGIRSVGSSSERKFDVHEGEGGGSNGFAIHVQADSSGQIQYYASSANSTFYLLGYYGSGVTYTDIMEQFSLSSSPSWGSSYTFVGGASCIHEVLLGNSSSSTSSILGVRKIGSSLDRYIELHESERASGSTADTWYTSYVEADSSKGFGGYGYSTHCYDVGYFSSNVSLLEKFDALTMSTDDTWATHADYASLPGDSYIDGPTSGSASCNGTVVRIAQEFAGFDGTVKRVFFSIYKSGSPTGSIYAKLYDMVGSYPNSVIATSDAVAASSLTSGYTQWVCFTFSSPYTIDSLHNYVISVEYTGDITNYISIGNDTSNPSMLSSFYYTSSWTAVSTYDVVYYLNKPEAVAMIACVHQDTTVEEDLGARTYGSSTARQHVEHEAESNGFTGATYPVNFGAQFQTIAGDASEAGFYNLGYLYYVPPTGPATNIVIFISNR